MIKVCHITSAHGRYDDRIFQKECISLARKYEVHLLVNDDLENICVDGVFIHSAHISISNRIQRMFSVRKLFKQAIEIDADIYHLHDPELLMIVKPLLRHGKKVIFDSHEFYSEQIKAKEYIPIPCRKIIAYLYNQYETYICRKIDAVILICPIRGEKGIINAFEGRCKRYQYIANYPVEHNYIGGEKRKNTPIQVVYAGGLTYERGITYLIDACYRANCKLVLAGSFSSDAYRRELEKKESFKCVDYRGQCTASQVYQIYKGADIGAATLLDYGQYFKAETFPVKVYEYFQMKLPVLISNYPYAKEMNAKYHFGVAVTPNSIESLVNGINEIIAGLEKESLGENGYELYKKHLNWSNEAQKLFALYQEILKD